MVQVFEYSTNAGIILAFAFPVGTVGLNNGSSTGIHAQVLISIGTKMKHSHSWYECEHLYWQKCE